MGLPKKRRIQSKGQGLDFTKVEAGPDPTHLAYKVVAFPKLGLRLDLGRVYTLAELEQRCKHSPARRRALQLKLADPNTFKPTVRSKQVLKLASLEQQGTVCGTKWRAGSLRQSPAVDSCGACTERGCEGLTGSIRRGAFVRLHSLCEAPEMNGRNGLCLDVAEGDRLVVHIDGDPPGSYFNIRQKNLQQVVTCEGGGNTEAPAAAQGVLSDLELLGMVHGIVEIGCREQGQDELHIDPGAPKRRLLLKWASDREVLAKEITEELRCSLQWKYLKLCA